MRIFFGIIICLLLLTSAMFTVSRSFPDTMIEPKWYATISVMVVGCMAWAIYAIFSKHMTSSFKGSNIFELCCVAACTVQAVYFMLYRMGITEGYGQYSAGSFDNVAGFASCVCLSMPLGWRCLHFVGERQENRWLWLVGGIFLLCKVACVAAVIMSGSRTGMLCLLLTLGLLLLRGRRKIQLLLIPSLMVVAVVMMFSMKTASSLGRWFIVQRTAELIAERPLTGWGTGGFDARYMDVQADYFAAHPDSRYAMLAGNVRHPLNEFLLIAVNYGAVGLLAVMFLAAFVIARYLRCPSPLGRTGMMVLACIVVFSMFSYPFLYPFTWLMLCHALLCIFRPAFRHVRMLCLFALLLLPIVAYMLIGRMTISMELRRIQDKTDYGLARRMMPEYERLYPHMSADFRFLYNYSAMQYEAGLYAAALRTADECGRYLSDYDLCLLKGDIYRELKEPEKAVAAYHRAHLMCPSRFEPLYQMALVHKFSGNMAEARAIAAGILKKTVKVPSADITDIKHEMEKLISGE